MQNLINTQEIQDFLSKTLTKDICDAFHLCKEPIVTLDPEDPSKLNVMVDITLPGKIRLDMVINNDDTVTTLPRNRVYRAEIYNQNKEKCFRQAIDLLVRYCNSEVALLEFYTYYAGKICRDGYFDLRYYCNKWCLYMTFLGDEREIEPSDKDCLTLA
jgi:hypothetical protein